MKANQQVEHSFDFEKGTITFTVNDGGEDIVLDMNKLHGDIITHAAYFGMAQVRMVDATAISAEDPDDGHIRTAEERMTLKRARLTALRDHYETGTADWKRTGGGEGAKSLTIEAIANLAYSADYEKAEIAVDKLAEKKGKTRAKLLADFRNDDPAVSAEMKRIRDMRPKKAPKVSAQNLLSELAE